MMDSTDCDSPDVSRAAPSGYLYVTDNGTPGSSPTILPIWDSEVFKIGRNPQSNTFPISTDADNAVSRNHCEIYVVAYEPSVHHVYVRDRKSFNGTYVNGQLIGIGPRVCAGFLLQDGDVIEIRPHWRFLFRQNHAPPTNELSSLQVEEAKLFSKRYILTQRCLGSGSEASVYLAVDAQTRKQLVCKLVNLDKIHGPNAKEIRRRRFQEAEILRQLRHPNILAFVDAISSPHSLFTFTELASGGDLFAFLYCHTVITEFDARVILRQIIQGLSYLHGRGIIHRDLKPENILLLYSSKIPYQRIVLSDFGTCGVPRRSRMLTNVGTANYQAPEFFTRQEVQTFAVDIWSLGMVTLLLLTSGAENYEELNRMDQGSLDQEVVDAFRSQSVNRSLNSLSFLWNCLQVSPSKRMTANEAASHPWFSTSESLSETFERLDREMLVDWSDTEPDRPLPSTIPSILDNHSQVMPFSERPAISVEGHSNQALDCVLENEMTTRGPRRRSDSSDLCVESTPANHTDTLEGKRQGPDSKFYGDDGIWEKPAAPPWVKFSARRLATSKSGRKGGKLRFGMRDTTMLPLTNLDRHLKAQPKKNLREDILKILRKTDRQFLDEAMVYTQ